MILIFPNLHGVPLARLEIRERMMKHRHYFGMLLEAKIFRFPIDIYIVII